MKIDHTGSRRSPDRRFLYGVVWLIVLAASGCGPSSQPSIRITTIPPEDKGGGQALETISGRVTGASAGQQVVLYARSGAWYVQPFVETPFTPVNPDGTWSSPTHLGTEYAALLVKPDYVPPPLTLT